MIVKMFFRKFFMESLRASTFWVALLQTDSKIIFYLKAAIETFSSTDLVNTVHVTPNIVKLLVNNPRIWCSLAKCRACMLLFCLKQVCSLNIEKLTFQSLECSHWGDVEYTYSPLWGCASPPVPRGNDGHMLKGKIHTIGTECVFSFTSPHFSLVCGRTNIS